MTYVEFYDKSGIENICSALIKRPKKIIFVGTQKNAMERFIRLCKRIFDGDSIDYEAISFPTNASLNEITQTFYEIMQSNQDCVFDLTGGSEAALVAVGVAAERYQGQGIQMHKINVRTGAVTDVDMDGMETIYEDILLSVQKTVLLNGGLVVETPMLHSGAAALEHADDIDALWELRKQKEDNWNWLVAGLAYLEAYARRSENTPFETGFTVDLSEAEQENEWNPSKSYKLTSFLAELKREGMLSDLALSDNRLTVEYRNEFLQNCLTHPGAILEWKVLLEAAQCQTDRGDKLYHDCLGNVCIHWGQAEAPEDANMLNEIDAILMKGTLPVFISCKNGSFDVNELYKFSTVANTFGGKYVRKVLFSAKDDLSTSLIARAEEMGIRVISGLFDITEAAFQKKMKSLWN